MICNKLAQGFRIFFGLNQLKIFLKGIREHEMWLILRQAKDGAMSPPSLAARCTMSHLQPSSFTWSQCFCGVGLAHKAAVSFGPDEIVWKKYIEERGGKKDLLANSPHHTYFSDQPNINININLAMGKFMWILVVWTHQRQSWITAQPSSGLVASTGREEYEDWSQAAPKGVESAARPLEIEFQAGETGPLSWGQRGRYGPPVFPHTYGACCSRQHWLLSPEASKEQSLLIYSCIQYVCTCARVTTLRSQLFYQLVGSW